MRKNTLMIAVLVISMIGLSTGFYFKFVKTYLKDIQTNTINDKGESAQRNLTLSENINFLEELDNVISSQGIDSKENATALITLKRINSIAISTMIVSILLILWAITVITKSKRLIRREL